MEKKLIQLKYLLGEIQDLESSIALLGWDMQVNMPLGGAEARGNQRATLNQIAHTRKISPEIGNLIEDLEPYAQQLDPDSDDARLIKFVKHDFEKNIKIPPELMAELARATVISHGAWVKAREAKDFSIFKPHLENNVDLTRQYIEVFAPYEHVYDPLLDRFEPGMKTVEVKKIFDELRPQQVELIKAISEQPALDDSFLHQPFDKKKQWDFGVNVISDYGYDWDRGRQDISVHPFSTNFSINDVRITTRVNDNYLNPALFGTMHECGHALYEQGVAQNLERSPLARGASLAMHESQSRLYENLLGRSMDLWSHFYPKLQQTFPTQLANVDINTFYAGINRVKPSYIRVEADEATYNLHIMLRLELEIKLFQGDLEVKDLPDAWNSGMEDYLGLTPPNDALGVLQDTHWADGYFGYFSTYALGNLISAQIWEVINNDLPDLSAQVKAGEFSSILKWLRENIHAHGRKFEPQELVKRITGDNINPAAYIRYLKGKFGELYNI